MDIHREVIGQQYYLYVSLDWFPIRCIVNETMLLVDQHLLSLTEEEGLIICVSRQERDASLLEQPVIACSAAAKQRGVVIGMEAQKALALMQQTM